MTKVISPSVFVVPQDWIDHFVKVEGKVSHFYLDGVGNVTIGVGCVLSRDSSQSLLLRKINDPIFVAANRTEIIREYNEIANKPAGQKLSYYKNFCTLYLPEDEIFKLLNARVNNFILAINQQIADLTEFPQNAQLVLLDMTFNLGVHKLTEEFPKFLQAFLSRDWKTAANECHRLADDIKTPALEGIPEWRNAWAKRTLEELI